MTSKDELRGALDAVERVLNRGGDADEVLRGVVGVLHERFAYVAIRFVERNRLVDGPSAGDRADGIAAPVEFRGTHVAELEVATDDSTFVRRVATLISPYCLVGWDTGGAAWEP